MSLNEFLNVHAYNFMMSDTTRKMSFNAPSGEIGSTGGQMVEDDSSIDTCRSIDDLVLFSFDFPAPDYVKIDIDGQELAVVKGMVRTLPRLKGVLIEVSSKTVDDVVEIMVANGFTTENSFNDFRPHSTERRLFEGIDATNIIFTRRG